MAEEKKYRTQEEITSELYHDAMMAMQTTKLPRERTTGMTLPEFMAYWEAKTLALITELETVRAERDMLKATVEGIRDIAENPQRRGNITQLCNAALQALRALNTQPQAEWTPRFVVGETVRVDRFIDDAFAGWLGEIEQIKRVGDTCEYYLAAKNHPGFERYPFGWFAEKLLDNNDNVPDWVEGMDKEAD